MSDEEMDAWSSEGLQPFHYVSVHLINKQVIAFSVSVPRRKCSAGKSKSSKSSLSYCELHEVFQKCSRSGLYWQHINRQTSRELRPTPAIAQYIIITALRKSAAPIIRMVYEMQINSDKCSSTQHFC
jgi:hypothetical protein